MFSFNVLWGKSKWSAPQFQCISIALNLAYNKNNLHKALDYWFRDIFDFDFLEKGLGIVSPPHFVKEKYFSCYILLTDQISLSDCLYFLRYWAICVLHLFVYCMCIRVYCMCIAFRFSKWPKCQAKNLNILRTKRAFKMNRSSRSQLFLKISQISQENTCVGVSFW